MIMMRFLSKFRVTRFFGWWFGMTGMVASTSTCPCCGQQGCPIAPAAAALLGGLAAGLMTIGSQLSRSGRKASPEAHQNDAPGGPARYVQREGSDETSSRSLTI